MRDSTTLPMSEHCRGWVPSPTGYGRRAGQGGAYSLVLRSRGSRMSSTMRSSVRSGRGPKSARSRKKTNSTVPAREVGLPAGRSPRSQAGARMRRPRGAPGPHLLGSGFQHGGRSSPLLWCSFRRSGPGAGCRRRGCGSGVSWKLRTSSGVRRTATPRATRAGRLRPDG